MHRTVLQEWKQFLFLLNEEQIYSKVIHTSKVVFSNYYQGWQVMHPYYTQGKAQMKEECAINDHYHLKLQVLLVQQKGVNESMIKYFHNFYLVKKLIQEV